MFKNKRETVMLIRHFYYNGSVNQIFKRETISVQVKCQMSAHKITVTNVKLTRNRLVVNVLQRSLLASRAVNQIF
jgi:hypothetical protein